MEPEQVLELIRSAPERYESVRAALRYRGDVLVRKEIREHIVRRAFRVSPEEASEPIRHPEPNGPFGWRCRVWRIDKYQWRRELDLPDGGVDIAACFGHRRLPFGGPPGSGKVWEQRIGGGSRNEDPLCIWVALDTYWTFYPLVTDE